MIYERIILLTAIIASIRFYKETKPKLLKVIVVGVILCYLLKFTGIQYFVTITFFTFGILSFIYTIMSGLNKKWLNLVIGLFTFMSFLFKLMEYTYWSIFRLLLILPILCYIFSFRKLKSNSNELGILTLLIAYDIIDFLNLIISMWKT